MHLRVGLEQVHALRSERDVALKEVSMYLRSEFHWLHPNLTTEAVPVCISVETAGRRWETQEDVGMRPSS